MNLLRPAFSTVPFRTLVLVLGIGLCVSAPAIQRSDTGVGQYLIVPFAIASDDRETLFEINRVPTVSKLRVLDRAGQPRLTANLYAPYAYTWAGALTRMAGSARLVSSWDGCMLVEGPDGIEAVSEMDFDFTVGSVEIVGMGSADSGPIHAEYLEGGCEALAALWSDPEWDPNQGLEATAGAMQATVQVISVAKGTLYGVPVTALADFSDIPQHTEPASVQPDLASTHDAGTFIDQTRSVVCSDSGCVEDFWADPVDAASAALMTYTARDRFVISESLAARNEWIVTYPTMAYYDDTHPLSSSEVSMLIRTHFGEPLLPGLVISDPDHPFASSTSLDLDYDQALNVLDPSTTIDEVGEQVPSALFGIGHDVQSPAALISQLPETGSIRLGFSSPVMSIEPESGRRYWGRPAIVTTFTEFTNGVLQSEDGVPQRANYGSSGDVSTTVRIDEPEE